MGVGLQSVILLYLRRGAHARAKQLEDTKGDHPWRTGGRPTRELARSNQSILMGIGLQQQSVHLKRAALTKGDHPWRTGGRPTRELAKRNQSIRKRLDFNPNGDWIATSVVLKVTPCHQQQSVHLKRAALLKRLFAELE